MPFFIVLTSVVSTKAVWTSVGASPDVTIFTCFDSSSVLAKLCALTTSHKVLAVEPFFVPP